MAQLYIDSQNNLLESFEISLVLNRSASIVYFSLFSGVQISYILQGYFSQLIDIQLNVALIHIKLSYF